VNSNLLLRKNFVAGRQRDEKYHCKKGLDEKLLLDEDSCCYDLRGDLADGGIQKERE